MTQMSSSKQMPEIVEAVYRYLNLQLIFHLFILLAVSCLALSLPVADFLQKNGVEGIWVSPDYKKSLGMIWFFVALWALFALEIHISRLGIKRKSKAVYRWMRWLTKLHQNGNVRVGIFWPSKEILDPTFREWFNNN